MAIFFVVIARKLQLSSPGDRVTKFQFAFFVDDVNSNSGRWCYFILTYFHLSPANLQAPKYFTIQNIVSEFGWYFFVNGFWYTLHVCNIVCISQYFFIIIIFAFHQLQSKRQSKWKSDRWSERIKERICAWTTINLHNFHSIHNQVKRKICRANKRINLH